jgi:hypothetical protein
MPDGDTHHAAKESCVRREYKLLTLLPNTDGYKVVFREKNESGTPVLSTYLAGFVALAEVTYRAWDLEEDGEVVGVETMVVTVTLNGDGDFQVDREEPGFVRVIGPENLLSSGPCRPRSEGANS